MKKLNVILIVVFLIVLVAILIVMGAYIWVFHDQSVIAETKVWGDFGAYFGGVLGPVLSFFAFVGLLLTLRQNHEAHKSQWSYLEQIEKKKEWFVLIEHTEGQINKFLDQRFPKNDGNVYRLGGIIKELGCKVHESGMDRDTEYAEKLLSEMYEGFKLDHLRPLSALVESLGLYVDQYTKCVFEKNADIIAGHYVSSYLGYVKALQRLGVSLQKSDDVWLNLIFKYG